MGAERSGEGEFWRDRATGRFDVRADAVPVTLPDRLPARWRGRFHRRCCSSAGRTGSAVDAPVLGVQRVVLRDGGGNVDPGAAQVLSRLLS